jgi:hypothetical protein
MTQLLTREELSRLLNVSTRTLDRWRSTGLDLGEVRVHSLAMPRFDPEKVSQCIRAGASPKVKKRRTGNGQVHATPKGVPPVMP